MNDQLDYTRKDTVDVGLFMSASPLANGPDGIVDVLTLVDRHAGPLQPVQFFNKKAIPYSHQVVRKALAARMESPRVVIDLIRGADPEVTLFLNFATGSAIPFWLEMSVPFGWLAGEHSAERSAALVGLLRAVATAFPVAYGYAHSKADLFAAKEPHLDTSEPPFALHDVYWLNILGGPMIQSLGRERVATVPAHVREPLPNDSVLLLTRPTPVDYASDAARIAQARAFAHLTGAEYAPVLARLSERSATLHPVERQFSPDVAEVIDRLLDVAGVHNRPAETAKWNLFRPPAPTEWRPASDQPPANVADPAGTIEQYESLWAERLVALLHKPVPDVVNTEPTSLPAIDAYMYREDFPSNAAPADIEHDLVPAVGAYIGMLLVTVLGGRWVPMEALDDTAVVVGERAWLPFLRAKHYLQSHTSVLEYSLTQFFKHAAQFANRG